MVIREIEGATVGEVRCNGISCVVDGSRKKLARENDPSALL